MPEPLITIITPFKNTESFIEECVQSIINQSYTNWEAIFVDDNSTDRSFKIMETFTLKEKRIKLLKNEKGFDTSNIEDVVEEVSKNIFKEKCKALVIYGEPQSGKTETMIALTAKLLDEGKKHILLLVTDNVKLRDQNLGIFAKSRINPTPQEECSSSSL